MAVGLSWSPNGEYIAFDGWWWMGGGVWIQKIDTLGNPQGWPVQLTTSGYGPTWKNNSKEIVFIDWPTGDPDLYSIPVTGGTTTRVYGQTGGFERGDYDPAYANNGQFIAYSGFTDNTSITSTNQSVQPGSLQKTALPASFILEQNFPNPFQNETKISFRIKEATHVLLNIYNGVGQKIHTLVNADYTPGYYTVQWNGKDKAGTTAPGGIYMYRLQTKEGSQTKGMSLLR